MADEDMEFAEPDEPNFVAFKAAGQDYCINIMNVREIRRWVPATALPKAPDFVRGVINLRGAVVPILDFSRRLGLSSEPPTSRHVTIIVKVGSKFAGLLVDEVSEILNIVADAIRPTPEICRGESTSLITGVISHNEQMFRLIDLNQFVDIAEANVAI